MAGKNIPRTTLKGFFKAGEIPREENFADLIDVGINQSDDGLQKSNTDPLKIQAAQSNPNEEVLRLYKDIKGNASWILGLNPQITPGGNRNRGLHFGDGTGNIRFFIDEGTGHIGVGHAHPQNLLDLGPTQGKKLALYQNAQGSDFYGLGISDYSLDFHAGSDTDGTPKMVVKKSGNVGIGLTDPGGYRIRGVAGIPNQWAYRFDNLVNGSNIHIAHGGGYGLHVNGGENANANTYLLQLHSANNVGELNKFQVNGDGAIRANAYKTDWGFIFHNSANGSDIHVANGNGNGLHVNGGKNASASTYLIEAYSRNSIGQDTKFIVKGDGKVGIGTLPGIQLAIGDSDTGLQQQGDGELAIYTDNRERVRIDNAGNVGIGTNNPQIQLALGDTDTGFQQQGDGELAIYTNNTEKVRIDASGNVGIGTSSPNSLLHLSKNSSNVNSLEEILRLERLADDASESANAEGGYIGLYLHDTNSGDPSSRYASRIEGARISWRFDNAANDEKSGRLSFWTSQKNERNPRFSDLHERMSIDRNGKVNIGTSNKSGSLEIYNSMSETVVLASALVPVTLITNPISQLGSQYQIFSLPNHIYLHEINLIIPSFYLTGISSYNGEFQIRLGGPQGSPIHSQNYNLHLSNLQLPFHTKVNITLPEPVFLQGATDYTFSFSHIRLVQGNGNISGTHSQLDAQGCAFELLGSQAPLKPVFSVGGTGIIAKGFKNIGDRRNLQWNDVTGQIGYDNSSRRDKENIQGLDVRFKDILRLQPRTYTRRFNESLEIGYIAEEVHSLGLTHLVYYNQDNQPDGLNYEKICLYLLEVLRDHEAAINPNSKYLERYVEEEPQEVIPESSKSSQEISKPSSKNTKAEIQAYLTAKGISFSKNNSKAELLKKIE